MKKKILIAVIAVGVLAIIVTASLRQRSGGRGVKVYVEEAARRARLVATVEASGEVRPRVEVNISSQVPGQIVELPVEEGDSVRAEQILVQLDPERYRSEVRRLEAGLRKSMVDVEKERVSLRTAEVTLRRVETLHVQGVISEEDLDQARLAVDSGRIALESQQQLVEQVEANLARARDDLSKTTLKSPIDGLVTRLNAKEGEQVIIGTMNNPGTVIMTLSDMGELLAEVRVDETEVIQVETSQRAEIRVDAVPDHSYSGLVESIGNSAQRDGTISRFPVKIQITDPDEKLRPGMSAHASIEVDERTGLLAIPLQALVRRSLKDYLDKGDEEPEPASGGVEASQADAPPGEDDDGDVSDEEVDPEREQVQVVIVERDGRAELVKIETGISDAFRVEVLEGLEEGDKVVLGPYRRLRSLKNGDFVRLVERSEAGEDDE
jgi:HlyD family secretion protein